MKKLAGIQKKVTHQTHSYTDATDMSTSVKNNDNSTGAKQGVPLFLKKAIVPEFPHRQTIEQNVNKKIPGEAFYDPDACRQRSTPAFTSGLISSFAEPNPPLHVAAHEAVHQLQHAGLTRDANLGAEEHAGHVADAVVSGKSSGHIICGTGKTVSRSVKNYTKISPEKQKSWEEWDVSRGNALVADDGMAVIADGHSKECYADEEFIANANVKLKAAKKGVELYKGTKTIHGIVPNVPSFTYDPETLHQVLPRFLESTDWLGSVSSLFMRWQNLPADCGKTARELMGQYPSGLFKTGGRSKYTRSNVDPAELRKDIQSSRSRLSRHEQTDEKLGLNEYAEPDVGESYVTVPNIGYAKAKYHWGFVILVTSSGDRVTIENLYNSGNDRNRDWYFGMYGVPKSDQTWHGQWRDRLSEQGRAMTMTTISIPTEELIRRYHECTDTSECNYLKKEISQRHILVRVKVNKTESYLGADKVRVKCGEKVAKAKNKKNETVELNDGDSQDFLIPLRGTDPFTGAYYIDVYDIDDWDNYGLDPNDLILDLLWFPYKEVTYMNTHRRPNYEVTVKFN